MLAYHNDPKIKADSLAQLAAHREADELVIGVPRMLARLEDCIFEGLPTADAQQWPERFMRAIEPGADLSPVVWRILHWLLTDKNVNPGIDHPLVRDTVRRCADMLAPLTRGEPVDVSAAWSAARAAARSAQSAESAAWSAWSARSAAWSAARAAAWSAWSAAWSARSAVESAVESAAWSARSARSAVESAVESARSAVESAVESAPSAVESAAESAVESAAYVLMAEKLIALLTPDP